MPLPDISSLDDYGGPKTNYAPVTDPTTDEDADDRNRYACDVAMMTHTAPRAWVRFVSGAGGVASDPAFGVHDAVWGSSIGVKPTITRPGAAGIWRITWPTAVQDELGAVHTVNLRAAIAQAAYPSNILKHAIATVESANVVKVFGFTAAGVADNIEDSVITVLAW